MVRLGFSTEIYWTFKERLLHILLKLFHKRETEGTPLSSFYEAIVTLIPKSHKERELQTSFVYEYRCKNTK